MRNDKTSHRNISVIILLTFGLLLAGCSNGKFDIAQAEHGTVNGMTAGNTITSTLPPKATDEAASPAPTGTPTPTAPPTETPIPTSTPSPTPTPVRAGAFEGENIFYSKVGEVSELPKFSGHAYVIMDSDGNILMSKNADLRIYPASTIKMLTALTAIDYYNLDTPIKSTKQTLTHIGQYYEYGLVEGVELPLNDYMHMLMINSCGDAAMVIANRIGQVIAGDENADYKVFVEAMNAKAKELHMDATTVDNPIGIDVGDGFTNICSTAADIARLTNAYMKVAPLAEIVGKTSYKVTDCDAQKGKKLLSTNYFLIKTEFKSSLFTAIGTKSGQTNAAANCYAATVVTNDGRTLTCCCFGLDQGENSRWILFSEMKQMLEYCIKKLK